ncbi:hypothetical protein HK096_004060 [Nowakowskiella sp. JEL0078]|nr:hypothetical protein HK096_004060 [Nowakowskiella sp. JEL0078]
MIDEFKHAIKVELYRIKDCKGMKQNSRTKAGSLLKSFENIMKRQEIITELNTIRREIDSEKAQKIYASAIKEKVSLDGVDEIDNSLAKYKKMGEVELEGNHPNQRFESRKRNILQKDSYENEESITDTLSSSMIKKKRSKESKTEEEIDVDDEEEIDKTKYSSELAQLLDENSVDVFDSLSETFAEYSKDYLDDLTKERIADLSPESYMYLKKFYSQEVWDRIVALECEPVDKYGPADVKAFLTDYFNRNFSYTSWQSDLESLLDFQEGESHDVRRTRIMLHQVLPSYFEAIFSSHNALKSTETYEAPYGVEYIYPLLQAVLRHFGEISFAGGDHPVAAAPSCERSDGIGKTKSGRELVSIELSRPVADKEKRVYDHVQLCRTLKDMINHNLISDALSQRSLTSVPRTFGLQVHQRMMYLGWIRFYNGVYWYLQYAKGYIPASPEELKNFGSILFDLICWSKDIGKYASEYEKGCERKPSRKSSAMNLQKAFELKDSKARVSQKKRKYKAYMIT